MLFYLSFNTSGMLIYMLDHNMLVIIRTLAYTDVHNIVKCNHLMSLTERYRITRQKFIVWFLFVKVSLRLNSMATVFNVGQS